MSFVKPTKNLELAKRDLAKHGYCIVADVLSAAQLNSLTLRIEQQAAAEQKLGIAFRDGGKGQTDLDEQGRYRSKKLDAHHENNRGVNQRVFFLTNKGQCFRDLIIHPIVEELVAYQLGAEFILSTFTANITKCGGARMGLHTDQWWMPQPVKAYTNEHLRPANITRFPVNEFINPDLRLGIAPPVVTSAMWMLSDFSELNGATEVVPGSHLSGAYPNEEDNDLRQKIVQAKASAGSVMVFDGRIWHGTGANTQGPDRTGLIAGYCSPQFRQQENITLGLNPALWNTLSTQLKARLGFKVWNAYGRIEADFGDFVSPFPTTVGELTGEDI